MKHIRDDTYGTFLNLMMGAGLVIVLMFAFMSVGTFVNGTVGQNLIDNIDTSTDLGNSANMTLQNVSSDYDGVLNSMMMAAFILAITLPLAAVVAIRRFL